MQYKDEQNVDVLEEVLFVRPRVDFLSARNNVANVDLYFITL